MLRWPGQPRRKADAALEAVPTDEIDRAIEAARRNPDAYDSAALTARYRACGLNVIADPNSGEVADMVAAALAASRPYSVIRMNDGEMNLLAFRVFTDMPALDRFAAFRSLEKQSDSFRLTDGTLLMVRDLLFGAIAAADIVGVVGLWNREGPALSYRSPASEAKFFRSYRTSPKALHGDRRGRTYMPALAEAGYLAGKTVASGLLYFGILEHLDRVVEPARSVLAITAVSDAVTALRRRFPHKEIEHLAVGRADMSTTTTPEFLADYEAALPTDLRGALCLIGAGPWAEVYSVWIKRRGGVAVDLGSGFDLLVGNRIREPHRQMIRAQQEREKEAAAVARLEARRIRRAEKKSGKAKAAAVTAPVSPLVQKAPKIFQIGFNKCGTTSLHAFFEANGIPSIHYAKGKISAAIKSNVACGRPPLAGFDHYTAYSDMSGGDRQPIYEGQLQFELLYQYYPNALFILNLRPIENWIASRLNHGTLAQRHMEQHGLKSVDELVALWRDTWNDHLANVARFFADKPKQFIRINIEDRDAGEQLAIFLEPYFSITKKQWPHKAKTSGERFSKII